ncbi:MAG: energy-coupling factor transporter transmembrane protein EcfT [candidate division Zixibacteria bacterium]|nr:energy-coupling factor transporter transmembrane protein EcfT [candidate division Zixibacteria bacterium]
MSLFGNLTLGQYAPGHSVIHRLDPRTKLCGAMGLMTALITLKEPVPLVGALTVLTALVLFAGLPIAPLLKNLRAFRWLLLITFLANTWFTPGQPAEVSGFYLPGMTNEGLLQGAVFALRMIVILLIAAILTLATAPIDMADGLETLLKPFVRFGLPAHDLAMMTVIALRFIPTLTEEAERLQKAQMARGADFSGNPLRRIRSMTSLLVPLLVSAFRRADDLAVAMEARCYRGGVGRTRYRQLGLTRNDYLALVLMTGGVAALALSVFI